MVSLCSRSGLSALALFLMGYGFAMLMFSFQGPMMKLVTEEIGWEPKTKQNTTEPEEAEVNETVHILMSVDENSYPGVPAVINSVQKNTGHPVKFHIQDFGKESGVLEYLDCYSIKPTPVVDIVRASFNTLDSSFKNYIGRMKGRYMAHLGSAANFGRFLFPKTFPTLAQGIYMDADLIVKGDIYDIWKEAEAHSSVMSAVPSPYRYSRYVNTRNAGLFYKRYKRKMNTTDPSFNAGVYFINLEMWREQKIDAEISWWVKQNTGSHTWAFPTNTPLNIVTYGKWKSLSKEWDICRSQFGRTDLRKAKILHFTGKIKPWHSNDPYKSFWLPSKPQECNGRGRCLQKRSTDQKASPLVSWRCACFSKSYKGHQCQNKT